MKDTHDKTPTPSVESWEEAAALTAVNAWSARHYSAFSTIIYQGFKEVVASTGRRVREEYETAMHYALDDVNLARMTEALDSIRQPPVETQPTTTEQ